MTGRSLLVFFCLLLATAAAKTAAPAERPFGRVRGRFLRGRGVVEQPRRDRPVATCDDGIGLCLQPPPNSTPRRLRGGADASSSSSPERSRVSKLMRLRGGGSYYPEGGYYPKLKREAAIHRFAMRFAAKLTGGK